MNLSETWEGFLNCTIPEQSLMPCSDNVVISWYKDHDITVSQKRSHWLYWWYNSHLIFKPKHVYKHVLLLFFLVENPFVCKQNKFPFNFSSKNRSNDGSWRTRELLIRKQWKIRRGIPAANKTAAKDSSPPNAENPPPSQGAAVAVGVIYGFWYVDSADLDKGEQINV